MLEMAYKRIHTDVITDYARDAGVLLKSGKVMMVIGFKLWYTVEVKDIQQRMVDGSRFWRMLSMGTTETNALSRDSFQGCPTPEKIIDRKFYMRDLSAFAFVAMRRTMTSFPGCSIRLEGMKQTTEWE